MSTEQAENDVLSQYGVSSIGAASNESIMERLYKRFRATDFIRVINPDTEPFSWVYSDPKDEIVEQPDRITKHIYPGKPKITTLQPGESRVILGGEGYVMIDAAVKKLIQKNSAKIGVGLRNGVDIEKYIGEVYMGITDPFAVNNQPQPTTAKTSVEEDLGLADEPTTGQVSASRATKKA